MKTENARLEQKFKDASAKVTIVTNESYKTKEAMTFLKNANKAYLEELREC